MTPSHASLSDPIAVDVVILKGDNVNITWDFGDGSPTQSAIKYGTFTYSWVKEKINPSTSYLF